MSNANTDGYDVAFVVTDNEMGRLVQTAFLERLPAQGLPVELELPVAFDNQDGTLSLPGIFAARFDLPTVNFAPSRNTIDTETLEAPEQPENTIEIRLPFRESAIEMDIAALGRFTVSNLKGTLSLIIPFGYPTNSDGDSVFGLDVQNLIVWLTLADDDPDSDQENKTTRDKVADTFAMAAILGVPPWSKDTQIEFETKIANNLKSTGLLTELTGLTGPRSNLNAAQCPTFTGSVSILDPDPSLDPPSDIRCIDFETFRPADDSPSFLALKLKLAAATYATGVARDSNNLGRSWIGSGERAAILMSDDFLLQSFLPPVMKRILLNQQLEGRDVGEQEAIAAEFFDNSLNLKKGIPLRLDLHLADENDEKPNTTIVSVSLAIVDDPKRDGNMVQATLELSGGVSWYYTFDATLRINIRVVAAGGQPGIEPEVDDDTHIDVHPHPAAYMVPAGIGALILAIFPIIGPVIVIADILPVILAVMIVDVGVDLIASCCLVPGMVNSELRNASLNTEGLNQVVPVLLQSTHFDDLVMRGELALVEVEAVSYEGYIPQGETTWRLELDRDPSVLSQLMAGDPPLLDAHTGVSAAAANVICEGITIRPANGTRLHDFGNVPLWQALNITQGDLRSVGYNVEDETSVPLASDPLSDPLFDPLHPINSALIDPLNFRDSSSVLVRAFGVRTQLGRFALLFVWNVGSSQLRGFYRRYNQALPGVELIPLFDETASLNPIDHRGCSLVIDGLKTVLVPTALDSLGSVSVEVGYSHYECVSQGEFEARPILLQRPLEFTWTIITSHGVRHTLTAERENKIDLEPQSTSTNVPNLSGSFVTLTLGGRNNARCSFATEPGLSGNFMIEVQVVERGGRTFTAERRVEFRGTRVAPTGYGAFARWLEMLHRGVQDPSTWPELGFVVPGFEPDPTTAPDLRDQPLDHPGWVVPGMSDPPGPGRDSLSGKLASRRLDRRYFTMRSSRERARTEYDPHMSKDQLLKKTLQSFQDLPDELRAQPKVKRYMANVMELVSSLPDPPTLDTAGLADGPSKIGWIQRFVHRFLQFVGFNTQVKAKR